MMEVDSDEDAAHNARVPQNMRIEDGSHRGSNNGKSNGKRNSSNPSGQLIVID